jgi:YjbE family integral membrane protein
MLPTLNQLTALCSVIIIDIVLAGDNAIVVGMASAGLPAEQRRKVIFLGIAAATLLRIAFATIALQLLAIIGLTLAGGLLLLWVSWKLFRELRHTQVRHAEPGGPAPPPKSTRQAVIQVVIADVSMSLDNVLAVAGVARTQEEPWVLYLGLLLSVALMGVASHLIARWLGRYPWLAWVGLAIITVVAVRMIWAGSDEVAHHLGWA